MYKISTKHDREKILEADVRSKHQIYSPYQVHVSGINHLCHIILFITAKSGAFCLIMGERTSKNAEMKKEYY
jgi:hypothetical protein